jgi:alkanesulfonate monooxygenase SsuD/methylene tetrahydromethanopterin reductase-like flavin-dependent oxidoreductase (luciferase family)
MRPGHDPPSAVGHGDVVIVRRIAGGSAGHFSESQLRWQAFGVTAARHWGVHLPTFDPFGTADLRGLVDCARVAEDLGFDTLWVGDHLVCPAPVLDALCALAAAAAVTTRAQLGCGVLQLGLRHLVWTAKQLATVGTLAPGRLRIGVGVGGEFAQEFTAAGVDRRTRGGRLDEMLDVLPALLTGQPIDYEGTYLVVHSPPLLPALESTPPLAVGGRSDAALQRAARYGDQWIAMWQSPATVRRCAERLAELAAAAGRPVPKVAMLVLAHVDDDLEAARREASAALFGQYRLAFETVDRWTAYGPVEEVAKLLLDYRDAGAEEILLLPLASRVAIQYERFAAVRELVEAA